MLNGLYGMFFGGQGDGYQEQEQEQPNESVQEMSITDRSPRGQNVAAGTIGSPVPVADACHDDQDWIMVDGTDQSNNDQRPSSGRWSPAVIVPRQEIIALQDDQMFTSSICDVNECGAGEKRNATPQSKKKRRRNGANTSTAEPTMCTVNSRRMVVDALLASGATCEQTIKQSRLATGVRNGVISHNKLKRSDQTLLQASAAGRPKTRSQRCQKLNSGKNNDRKCQY